jgi:polyphosphate kinase
MNSESVPFINRDLSWLDFNARVLAEGLRADLPPLDRFRLMAIVSSNLDEFYMVRYAAMKRALRAGLVPAADPAGLSPEAQIRSSSEKVRALINAQYNCLSGEIFPALAAGGLELVRPDQYSLGDMDFLESFFRNSIFPVLTPLRFDAEDEGNEAETLRMVSNLSIHAAFLLEQEQPDGNAVNNNGAVPREHVSLVKIPRALSRIVRLPVENLEAPDDNTPRRQRWALLDDLILIWGISLFSGYAVKESLLFKINRDADFSVDEERDEDFVEAMEEVLTRRDSSRVMCMVYAGESKTLRENLARRFELEEQDIFQAESPLDLPTLMALVREPNFDTLRRKPRRVYPQPAFPEDEALWDRIKLGDVMLQLPYQSFDPVLRFFEDAARDPQVIAIKTALYRTSGDSPIVKALETAALNGKHVTALVELKARFDEAQNIAWANRLEKAGVIVVYGLARLKVHAKITLIIRREEAGIQRYVHLSTGNYNDKTAAQYSDICLFTAREDIAFDAGLLFNMITGYSSITATRSLVIAPTALKRRLIELINREADRSTKEMPGRIMAKMKSLADRDVIKALYRASEAGVRVSLNIRGICMLVPGVPGFSENIEVIGIVDRYLEHARIFFFANAGAEEVYLSSADWMPRNLERRIELMFPLTQQNLREEARSILEAYFRDNLQSWRLGPNGSWIRRSPERKSGGFSAQEYFLRRAAETAENLQAGRQEFTVRRRPPE